MIGYTCNTVGCQTPVWGIPDCFDVNPEGIAVGTYAGLLLSEASVELHDAAVIATDESLMNVPLGAQASDTRAVFTHVPLRWKGRHVFTVGGR